MQTVQPLTPFTPHAYLIFVGELAEKNVMRMAEELRKSLPSLALLTHCGGGNFKKQFKKADQSGAKWAFILGENEIQENKITIKFLRETREQISLSMGEMIELIRAELK
jgi:histidyl-tRNA synthetase